MTPKDRLLVILFYVVAIGVLSGSIILVVLVGWGGGWLVNRLTGLDAYWSGIGVGLLAFGAVATWSWMDLRSSRRK